MLNKRVVRAFDSILGLCTQAEERERLGMPVVDLYRFFAIFYSVSRDSGERLCLIEVDDALDPQGSGLKRHVIELILSEDRKFRFYATTYGPLKAELENCGLSLTEKEDGLPGEVEVEVLSDTEAPSTVKALA